MKYQAILLSLACAGATPLLQAQSVDTVLSTGLNEPHSVVVDEDNLYISDGGSHRILKFDQTSGKLSVLAGLAGNRGAVNATGANARFDIPQGMVAARGGLVVADYNNQLIRFVTTNGTVTTLAGQAKVIGSANGSGSSSLFAYPVGLAVSSSGTIYIADSKNSKIRRLSPNNQVDTVASLPYEPSAVAVGDNNELWVASRSHVIWKIDGAGVVTQVAGDAGDPGYADADFALEARFQTPQGLLWQGADVGLLIADTDNQVVRRLYPTADGSSYSVITFAGTPHAFGLVNGPLTTAKFHNPISLISDSLNNGFLVVDRVNNALRRIQVTPPSPPINTPALGMVTFKTDINGEVVTQLVPITDGTFNNDVIIAVKGEALTQNILSWGPTPTNLVLDTVPNPNPRVASLPAPYATAQARPYADGISRADFLTSFGTNLQVAMQPDLTIKTISAASGRRPSITVKSRMQFIVAQPTLNGRNAADFSITVPTTDAALWYTVDGSEPTNQPPSILATSSRPQIPAPIDQPVVFKMQGFKEGYKPSKVVSFTFEPSEFQPNRISFGFEANEISTRFTGAPGQIYYAPVTLSLLPNQKVYSLQFSITATNLNGAPFTSVLNSRFASMLKKPAAADPSLFDTIDSQTYLGVQFQVDSNYVITTAITNVVGTMLEINVSSVTNTTRVIFRNDIPRYTNLVSAASAPQLDSWANTNGLLSNITNVFFFTNIVELAAEEVFGKGGILNEELNLMGLSWFQVAGRANGLYNATAQDLITFSMAHNTLFLGVNQKVVLGGYSFVIPTSAQPGQSYRLSLNRPSATSDGVQTDLYIQAPQNGTRGPGTINAVKDVVVQSASPAYVIGDAAPFRWLNAGDFGNGSLLNNDLLQLFQSVAFKFNIPPTNSDFFDALDSCCLTVNGENLKSNAAFLEGFGVTSLINQSAFGDGDLDVTDLYVTLRRSLDPSLKWYARSWSNGARQAVEVPNTFPGDAQRASSSTASLQSFSSPISTTNPPPSITFSADDAVTQPGATLQVPIRAQISEGSVLRILALNLSVQPLEGAPALAEVPQFIPAAGLGNPRFAEARTNGYAAAWLDEGVPGLRGSTLVGTLILKLDANASTNAAYAIHFDAASASPNGLALFTSRTENGLVTLGNRLFSSAKDGIPDAWRLRYFGSLTNLLSQALADADGDGVPNWAEFKAGTHPMDLLSKLQLRSEHTQLSNGQAVRLRWPSVLNKRYVLESSTALGGNPWSPLTTNITGTGQLQEVVVPSPAGANGQVRFYRVRIAE